MGGIRSCVESGKTREGAETRRRRSRSTAPAGGDTPSAHCSPRSEPPRAASGSLPAVPYLHTSDTSTSARPHSNDILDQSDDIVRTQESVGTSIASQCLAEPAGELLEAEGLL